jgi:hypothetical protein
MPCLRPVYVLALLYQLVRASYETSWPSIILKVLVKAIPDIPEI